MATGVYVRTQEHRDKIAKGLLGHKLSEETRHRIGEANSEALANRKLSADHCKNISGSMIGRTFSKEHLQKISKALTKQWSECGVGEKHKKIVELYGKADCCESVTCEGKSQSFDWANTDHKYSSPERKFWQKLCKPCHRIYDYRVNN